MMGNLVMKISFRIISSSTIVAVLSSPSSSQVPKGSHVYALIQTTSRCSFESKWNPKFVGVRIYHSNSDRYYVYIFNEQGERFSAGGGIATSKLEGSKLETSLEVIGSTITYRSQLKNKKRPITLGASVSILGNRCEVFNCEFALGGEFETNGCVAKCRPENCEIRLGPPS
jgi:hypothetical protein